MNGKILRGRWGYELGGADCGGRGRLVCDFRGIFGCMKYLVEIH